ncbi:MAG: ATP-binding cassette domain-containing protein [Desulfonauticus sp.]|nr:ATP-binding cassette domain-containing protein [Desulfonauticus sp.]
MLKLIKINKSFEQKKGLNKQKIKVLTDVSFEIKQGDVLGLVGESGSGKSTLGKIIVGLESQDQGTIVFRGQALSSPRKARPLEMQMVFQDPLASLNPRHKIQTILEEPLKLNTNYSESKRKQIVKKWLDIVKLPQESLNRYPHQFSGGQRQRIVLARAFILEPKLVVLDEPVSSLDVSIQAQLLKFLQHIQQIKKMTYIFISHDLAVVKYLANKIAIIYKGHIVEQGLSSEIFIHPKHPYSQMLLEAVPRLGRPIKTFGFSLDSSTPKDYLCPFETHCRYRAYICSQKPPPWQKISPTHGYACHRGG